MTRLGTVARMVCGLVLTGLLSAAVVSALGVEQRKAFQVSLSADIVTALDKRVDSYGMNLLLTDGQVMTLPAQPIPAERRDEARAKMAEQIIRNGLDPELQAVRQERLAEVEKALETLQGLEPAKCARIAEIIGIDLKPCGKVRR